jgi:hypothetical protein
MSETTNIFLHDAKELLDRRVSLERFQDYVGNVWGVQEPIDWVYLFQKVYLHACLRRRTDVASWFQEVCFQQLDAIQQIAVRQVFAYGRHLLGSRRLTS